MHAHALIFAYTHTNTHRASVVASVDKLAFTTLDMVVDKYHALLS